MATGRMKTIRRVSSRDVEIVNVPISSPKEGKY